MVADVEIRAEVERGDEEYERVRELLSLHLRGRYNNRVLVGTKERGSATLNTRTSSLDDIAEDMNSYLQAVGILPNITYICIKNHRI